MLAAGTATTANTSRSSDDEASCFNDNNSDDERIVPWQRYSEISADLKVGKDVVTGKSVDMSHAKVAPATALIVEFER